MKQSIMAASSKFLNVLSNNDIGMKTNNKKMFQGNLGHLTDEEYY